jgi:hypothetical protein
MALPRFGVFLTGFKDCRIFVETMALPRLGTCFDRI